ncbi:MAG: hypothetical protein WCL54_04520, partial [Clostridia bacterium]
KYSNFSKFPTPICKILSRNQENSDKFRSLFPFNGYSARLGVHFRAKFQESCHIISPHKKGDNALSPFSV